MLNQDSQLLSLPDELLLYIFSFLSKKELCRLALTCQGTKRVAEDDSLWAKELPYKADRYKFFWMTTNKRLAKVVGQLEQIHDNNFEQFKQSTPPSAYRDQVEAEMRPDYKKPSLKNDFDILVRHCLILPFQDNQISPKALISNTYKLIFGAILIYYAMTYPDSLLNLFFGISGLAILVSGLENLPSTPWRQVKENSNQDTVSNQDNISSNQENRHLRRASI